MDISGIKANILSLVEPERSEKFLNTLNAFIDSPDDKDLKKQFIGEFSDIYKAVFLRYLNNSDDEKRFFLRYSVLEDFLSPEKLEKVQGFDREKAESTYNMDYPVVYVDEWMEFVNSEEIPVTAGDDLSKMTKRQTPAEKLKEFLQKHSNERKNLEKMVVLRQNYITSIHGHWKSVLMSIITKDELENVDFIEKVKNDREITGILELLPKLKATNSRITSLINQMTMASKTIDSLKGSVSEEDLANIQDTDNELMKEEFKSVRQLYKMCIGRRGNDMPVLTDHNYPLTVIDRAAAIRLFEWVRSIDPTIFQRTFLGIDSDNPPYTLLCPVIGKTGVCWEPIPKTEKETGRGKIALPIYPTVDEETIILRALGDYRWQKEKEIAGFRWMNEGLTGQYYNYHEKLKSDKKKGKKVPQFNQDLKESFIENYILWIKNESQGVQKLEKEVRQIFWFNIPFPQEIKETLKDRGFHFKHLYENDQRKAMSQGY
ncbi:MAG: hypothetical protein ACOCWO_06210 [Candidatus Muiribacteriaceae bacterium]